MNKLILSCVALIGTVFGSCAGNSSGASAQTEDNARLLVAYYSATGTTEKIAKEIAEVTGGDLIAISPDQPYTDADLDWRDKDSRSSKEMADISSRPAIKNDKVSLDAVDIIFIGYPIWWDQAPRVINTFIESNHLQGKKIITFCTSGGSTIDGSTRTLRATYPDLEIIQGKCLNGASKTEIEAWISSLDL